jgi:transcription elongation factor Elf1
MDREFHCPSCGAANKVTNPGVLMRVCDYCRTSFYWDKDSALRAGKKSIDLPASPRFRVGGGGKLRGKKFRVLGRLSYRHDAGRWDEWFIEMGGEILWLSEDEGELFVERPLELKEPVPQFEELHAGTELTLRSKLCIVEEIGTAVCEGGEGEIPFVVEVGETYPYADGTASDGSFIFGLEYDAGAGPPRAFYGQALRINESKREAGVARHAEDSGAGTAIRCVSCGKPYEGRREKTTKMVVCDACGSALELDEAEVRIVGVNEGNTPYFTFRIGIPLTFEGVMYEVMGRLVYEQVDEGVTYRWMEYVLYHPDKGYLWLTEEKGHFTVSSPIHLRGPAGDPAIRTKVTIGNEEYKVFERGTARLTWVDGALPWVAAAGEVVEFTTFINPPHFIDREVTRSRGVSAGPGATPAVEASATRPPAQEIEMFKGRYVSRTEIAQAAPKGTSLPGEPVSVHASQPYEPSAFLKGLGKLGVFFLVINFVLVLYGIAASGGKIVYSEEVSAEKYRQEYLGAPFEAPKDGLIYTLEGSTPVKNSWLAMDFALVNSKDQALKEMFAEASYYEGYDEGRWTEGSQSFSSSFKIEKAGVYRLLIHGTGGSGENGPARNEPVTLRLVEGTPILWYFIFPILGAVLVMILSPVARWRFEQRRWASEDADWDDED